MCECAYNYIAILECDGKRHWGCLFNVVEDPTEHNEISELYPEIVRAMSAKLIAEREQFWSSKYDGIDACPDYIYENEISSDLVVGDGENLNVCGCWMASNNYNGFAGPYQDLREDQKIYVAEEDDVVIGGGKVFGNRHLVEFKFNFIIYAALCAATIALLCVMTVYCWSKEEMIENGVNKMRKGKKRKRDVSNYGTAFV